VLVCSLRRKQNESEVGQRRERGPYSLGKCLICGEFSSRVWGNYENGQNENRYAFQLVWG